MKFIIRIEEDADVYLHDEIGRYIEGNHADIVINAMADIMAHEDNHDAYGDYHIDVTYHPFRGYEPTPSG